MIHQSFSIKQALTQSFQKIYNNIGFLFGLLLIQVGIIVGVMLLYGVSASMLAAYLQAPLDNADALADSITVGPLIALLVLRAFTILVEVLLFIVTIRIFLDIYDEGKSSYNDFFQIKRFIVPYIFASILFGIISAVGFVLLIVPGLIAITMLNFYDIIVIDQNCGAVEALKISQKLTLGTRLKLFLFIVVCTLLSIVSFGLLYPIILMARIDVYKKLKAAHNWF